MQKFKVFTAAAFLAAFGLSADDVQKRKINYFLSADVQSYSYKEFAPSIEGGRKLMEIYGSLWGINAGASMQTQYVEHMINASYFTNISTKYDGKAVDANGQERPHKVKSKTDRYWLAEYHLMPYILNFERLRLKADLGLGYRYLFNQVLDSYRREQHYLYYIAGLYAELDLNAKISLFSRAQYRGIARAWHKTYMTDIGFSNDMDLVQDHGHGYRAEVGANLHLVSHLWAFASLYYEYWNIGESNTKYSTRNGTTAATPFSEPQNYTQVIGFNVGFRF